MATYKVIVNGSEFAVKLLQRQGSLVEFSVADEVYRVDVQQCIELSEKFSGQAAATGSVSQVRSRGDGSVTAPMPGIIVSLPVRDGQPVKSGDTVAVIEAMKMENNIRAPRDGKVQGIAVTGGQEVNNGTVLMTIVEG